MNKQYAVLKFNLDVFAKPVKVVYNDDVIDLKLAKEVLRKFTIVK